MIIAVAASLVLGSATTQGLAPWRAELFHRMSGSHVDGSPQPPAPPRDAPLHLALTVRLPGGASLVGKTIRVRGSTDDAQPGEEERAALRKTLDECLESVHASTSDRKAARASLDARIGGTEGDDLPTSVGFQETWTIMPVGVGCDRFVDFDNGRRFRARFCWTENWLLQLQFECDENGENIAAHGGLGPQGQPRVEGDDWGGGMWEFWTIDMWERLFLEDQPWAARVRRAPDSPEGAVLEIGAEDDAWPQLMALLDEGYVIRRHSLIGILARGIEVERRIATTEYLGELRVTVRSQSGATLQTVGADWTDGTRPVRMRSVEARYLPGHDAPYFMATTHAEEVEGQGGALFPVTAGDMVTLVPKTGYPLKVRVGKGGRLMEAEKTLCREYGLDPAVFLDKEE